MASTSAWDSGSWLTGGSATAQAALRVGMPVLLVWEVAATDRVVGRGRRAVGVEHLRVGRRPLPWQVALAAVDLHDHAEPTLRALVVAARVGRVPDLDEVLDRGGGGAVEVHERYRRLPAG